MSKTTLFTNTETQERMRVAPLAERMRPTHLENYLGQQSLVAEGKPLRNLIESDHLVSMVFWGPPGTGKTTLATIIANMTSRSFLTLSAVTAGVKDIKQAAEHANYLLSSEGKATILFIDEIHRFHKGQQDALLPHVENGTFTLIGATTENPSFELNSALLSRCRVFILEALNDQDLNTLIDRCLTDKDTGLGHLSPQLEDKARTFLINQSGGDARSVMNILEMAILTTPLKKKKRTITLEILQDAIQKKILLYDKNAEEHYNTISALHKSMRGSDPQAALYWLGRMLQGGEDPLYLARRIVRFASEDIGNADPQALQVAIAATETCRFIGMPECELALAQAVTYMATAPKSNSLYKAYGKVKKAIEEHHNLPVPLHIRNAPTKLMKDIGYGKDYQYDHAFKDHIAPQTYLPDNIQGTTFYEPGDLGFEKEIKKRMDYWDKKRKTP